MNCKSKILRMLNLLSLCNSIIVKPPSLGLKKAQFICMGKCIYTCIQNFERCIVSYLDLYILLLNANCSAIYPVFTLMCICVTAAAGITLDYQKSTFSNRNKLDLKLLIMQPLSGLLCIHCRYCR